MNHKLSQIKNLLKKHKLDALLVSSIPNIIYLTGFSGFSKDEREAFLLITKERQYIFTDTRYSEAVRKEIPDFTLIERSLSLPLATRLQDILKKENAKNLGFEASDITVEEYNRFKKALPNIHFSPASRFLEEIRIRKGENELLAIEEACKIGDRAFTQILKQAEEGISEAELAVELEYFIKKQGADISFRPIVAFGENAALPHHVSTHARKLKPNDIVLFDFGAKIRNYCSDMTRTIFFGKPNDEFKKMYKTVRIAQEKAIEFIQNHLSSSKLFDFTQGKLRASRSSSRQSSTNILKASDVDHIARSYILDNTYQTIPHSLGHGIGLEVHEAPRLSPNSQELLQEGMVFSIEPGIYIPGFGGVRIEDIATIENGSLRLLTNAPKNLTVITNN